MLPRQRSKVLFLEASFRSHSHISGRFPIRPKVSGPIPLFPVSLNLRARHARAFQPEDDPADFRSGSRSPALKAVKLSLAEYFLQER